MFLFFIWNDTEKETFEWAIKLPINSRIHPTFDDHENFREEHIQRTNSRKSLPGWPTSVNVGSERNPFREKRELTQPQEKWIYENHCQTGITKLIASKPSWNTASKQRPSNAYNVQITLYEHWNNDVCQLGRSQYIVTEEKLRKILNTSIKGNQCQV